MKSPLMNQQTMALWKGRATWLAAIPALVILCLAAANRPDSDPEHMDRDATGIEGTWRVELEAPPAFPPGDFPPLPWRGTKTFIRGGVMLEKNEIPGNKPGFGVWKKIGPRKFTFTFEFFWEDPSATTPAKRFVRTKVRETVELTGPNSYVSVESFGEDYDHDGNLLYPAYVVGSHGTRMQVEPVQ